MPYWIFLGGEDNYLIVNCRNPPRIGAHGGKSHAEGLVTKNSFTQGRRPVSSAEVGPSLHML